MDENDNGYGVQTTPTPVATMTPSPTSSSTAAPSARPSASTAVTPSVPPSLAKTPGPSIGVVFGLVVLGALLSLVGLRLLRSRFSR